MGLTPGFSLLPFRDVIPAIYSTIRLSFPSILQGGGASKTNKLQRSNHMGDKSPKSKQKSKGQKDGKADASAKEKQRNIASKQQPAAAAPPKKKK